MSPRKRIKLKQTVLTSDWDQARGLFADQPSHKTYSQHVNTFAVLAHITARDQGATIMRKVFADASLAQSSIYFRAYTNAALREVSLGDRYLDSLGPWREMLSQGFENLGRVEWLRYPIRLSCLGKRVRIASYSEPWWELNQLRPALSGLV